MNSEFRKKVNYLTHELNHADWYVYSVIKKLKEMEQTEGIEKCISWLEKGSKQITDMTDYFYKYAQTHPDWDKKEETK